MNERVNPSVARPVISQRAGVMARRVGVRVLKFSLGFGPKLVGFKRGDTDYVIERVTYADLNLASEHGRRTLTGRVGYAVNNVCYEAVPYGDRNSVAYRQCTNGAWHRAGPQIASAVQRATEIAATGTSSIAAAAITIDISE